MAWILLSVVPVLFGLATISRSRPANRGKKKAPKAFSVTYPAQTVNGAVFTAFGMMAVVVATAYFDFELMNNCSLYYMVYVIGIGFVIALAMLFSNRCVSITENKISYIKGPFAKPVEYSADELAQLDVRKTEVRVLKADGTQMFSVGVMMENLDLFFAWTHERPGIKLTLNGKELPKNGGKQ